MIPRRERKIRWLSRPGNQVTRRYEMMKRRATVSAALVMSALLAMLAGCEREGPAEHAGKQVDKAVDKAGQQIEKAGDRIQDAAKGDKK
jgi:predicted small lipoprotein YifL